MILRWKARLNTGTVGLGASAELPTLIETPERVTDELTQMVDPLVDPLVLNRDNYKGTIVRVNRTRDGQWDYRLVAANGEIQHHSEGHRNKADAVEVARKWHPYAVLEVEV